MLNVRVTFPYSNYFDDLMDGEGVHVHRLPPLTTLLVRTTNSVYRIVVMEGCNIYVRGGEFFPDPTAAQLDGASLGGSALKVGWIGVGLLMEIRATGRRIVTSPVRTITTEWPGRAVVH